MEIFADEKKRSIIEKRVKSLFSTMPIKKGETAPKGEFRDKIEYIIKKYKLDGR